MVYHILLAAEPPGEAAGGYLNVIHPNRSHGFTTNASKCKARECNAREISSATQATCYLANAFPVRYIFIRTEEGLLWLIFSIN